MSLTLAVSLLSFAQLQRVLAFVVEVVPAASVVVAAVVVVVGTLVRRMVDRKAGLHTIVEAAEARRSNPPVLAVDLQLVCERNDGHGKQDDTRGEVTGHAGSSVKGRNIVFFTSEYARLPVHDSQLLSWPKNGSI